jgi:hypothetical protein
MGGYGIFLQGRGAVSFPFREVQNLNLQVIESVFYLRQVQNLNLQVLWMASSWYGMKLAHAVDTWLFL